MGRWDICLLVPLLWGAGCQGAISSNKQDISVNYTNYHKEEQLVDRTVAVLEAVSYGLTVDFVVAWLKLTVKSDDLVFGSTAAFEPRMLPTGVLKLTNRETTLKHLYAPYVYRTTDVRNGKVNRTADLLYAEITYDYTKSDWYSKTAQAYRTAIKSEKEKDKRIGHWTEPYFDEGGGNIRMITYSRPFALSAENTTLRGVTTVDIALEDIDVDMCERENECTAEAPQCNFIPGKGMVDYAYYCCMQGCLECRQSDKKVRDGVIYKNGNWCITPDTANHYMIKDFRAIPNNVTVQFESDTASRIPMVVTSVFSIILMIGWGFYLFKHRDLRVIKSSSPPFLSVMLLGGICTVVWPLVTFDYPPTTSVCVARLWLKQAGWVLMFGGLFLKTWRIYAIFAMKGRRRRKSSISDSRLMLYLLAIGGFFGFVLALWSTMDRPEVFVYTRTTVEGYKQSTLTINEISYMCGESKWAWIVMTLNVLMLVGGGWLSYAVRYTPSAFNESRFIAWAIYISTSVLVIEQAILLTRRKYLTKDQIYIVESLSLIVTTLVTINMIMVPKAIIIAQGRGNDVSVRPHKNRIIDDNGDNTHDPDTTTDENVGGPYKEQLEFLQRKYDALMRKYEKQIEALGLPSDYVPSNPVLFPSLSKSKH
eukprot:comp17414_c0_seq1/m.16776 comp17414_c0_seq1/g.16776  ORF comp17414_c0_seq1/g.16776 comp17414_c0_seq1/m.16776 type:complete len:648 (-) comp17414_c0_seq1:163-2106(-)